MRRSQAQRTAEMRLRLMEAAVACLDERGYSNSSISEVVRRAGVTRGALFHHFATRAELIAEAIWWRRKALWIEERNDLLAAIAAGAPLEQQLRLSWSHAQRRATIETAHRTAASADPELARELEAVYARNDSIEPRYNTTPVAWATVPGDPTPDMSRFIVGYFLTGMQVLAPFNPPELPEQALVKFASFLELAFAAMNREHNGDHPRHPEPAG